MNFGSGRHWTPLHSSCYNNHPEAVQLLLSHPSIDVNTSDVLGSSTFLLGCSNNNLSSSRVLLLDHRVDTTLVDYRDCSPLWWASHNGHLEVIERFIASGRDLGDLELKGRDFLDNEFSVREIATSFGKTEVLALLERFIADPSRTRFEVRMKLGLQDEMAAELFAATVFLCDELLQLQPTSEPGPTGDAMTTTTAAAARFFVIASKLPMELQMVLCHRVFHSEKQHILSKDSEAAFRALTTKILLSIDSPASSFFDNMERTRKA